MKPIESKKAELSVLSGLFIDPSKLDIISELLTADSFYATNHQRIYAAMLSADTIDPIVISEHVKAQGITLYDIQQIMGSYPSAENIEHHARIVQDKHTRRQALITMYNAMQSLQQDHTDSRDVISTAQKELDQSLPGDNKQIISDIYPEILETWESIVDMKRGGEKQYIETGFYDLDRKVLLSNGTLTILGASPRVGKTSFILCCMRHISQAGKRPILFTLEMTRRQIVENIIAQSMGICHQDMIRGVLSEEKEKAIFRRAGEWASLNIGVLDGIWNTTQIRHRLIKEKREKGVDIVFIDPLTKMPPAPGSNGDAKYDYYDANCETLVNVAVELNIPVVLAHHINREGAKAEKAPSLFDLKYAGENFANNVILMHREYLSKPTAENKNEGDFIIAKNRDGDTSSVKLGWDGPTKTFYNLTRAEPVMGGADQWR